MDFVMGFVNDVLVTLWLPILVATVACFIAASIIWMLGPHHKKEWKQLPNADEVHDALKKGNPAPGGYLLPGIFDPARKDDPVMKEKFQAGPLGTLYVRPGGWNMGKTLGLQFVFFLIVSIFVAHQAHAGSEWGEHFAHVFHDAAAAAFMGYFLASIPDSIWWGRPWGSLLRQLPDALIYAGLTGAAFGWLWPATG